MVAVAAAVVGQGVAVVAGVAQGDELASAAAVDVFGLEQLAGELPAQAEIGFVAVGRFQAAAAVGGNGRVVFKRPARFAVLRVADAFVDFGAGNGGA